MANQVRYVKKKRVTIRCARPFRIGNVPVVGTCSKVVLNVEDISKCISNKALVVENLLYGEDVPLDFSNYNIYNGPTDVDDDTTPLNDLSNFKGANVERRHKNGAEIQNTTEVKIGGGIRKNGSGGRPTAPTIKIENTEIIQGKHREAINVSAEAEKAIEEKRAEIAQEEAQKESTAKVEDEKKTNIVAEGPFITSTATLTNQSQLLRVGTVANVTLAAETNTTTEVKVEESIQKTDDTVKSDSQKKDENIENDTKNDLGLDKFDYTQQPTSNKKKNKYY